MSLDIAIIGGGASGMICAHLLDTHHRVTVFEKQAILGGNIRTLGRNVACPQLIANLVLDAGVIEFCSESFPVFHRLLDRLGIVAQPVLATTGCLRANGRHDRAPAKLAQARLSSCERLAGHLRLLSLTPELLRFRRRAAAADPANLYAHSLSDFLEPGPMGQWLRLLMVYAYSIPRAKIDNMPAALTIPTLLQFTGKPKWTSLPQGVYSYIEAITQRMRGRMFTGAEVSVRRQQSRVVVARKGASPEVFDRVIVAATPGQVLNILADPTPEEQRRFTPWQDNRATAIIHDDDELYYRRGVTDFSEFDVFEQPPGYNAYLNNLAKLPPSTPRHYHFSYNLESEIDPARILHRQHHQTPGYCVSAYATVPEIKATNGENNTYFAGAWLANGLHEGATQSAVAVANLLGGEKL